MTVDEINNKLKLFGPYKLFRCGPIGEFKLRWTITDMDHYFHPAFRENWTEEYRYYGEPEQAYRAILRWHKENPNG